MADHVTTVTRQDGRYWVNCEVCGMIASSQTQKAVMQQKADQHRESGGVAQARQPRAGSATKTTTVTPKAATPESPAGVAPVHRKTPFGNSVAYQTNTCRDCQGPLKATDGHYHETPEMPTRAVCCDCRAKLLPKNHVLACQAKKEVA